MVATAVSLSVALPARAEKEIATAGTGNPTLTTGDAPDSICPYGWRLPSGSGSAAYRTLWHIYTSRTSGEFSFGTGAPPAMAIQPPIGFNRDIDNKFVNISGYWSRSYVRANNLQVTQIDDNHVYFGYEKTFGDNYSLRCLAR